MGFENQTPTAFYHKSFRITILTNYNSYYRQEIEKYSNPPHIRGENITAF